MSSDTKPVLTVTSIEALNEYAKGAFVELPAFAEDQTFVARLVRPSMLDLAKRGKIPNSLLGTANSLFAKSEMDDGKTDMLNQILELCEILAEESFKEPKYSEIKAAGIKLTDDQMMFIFSYCQNGVKALEPFRRQQKLSAGSGSESAVQGETVENTGN
jgi:hypothetical protein